MRDVAFAILNSVGEITSEARKLAREEISLSKENGLLIGNRILTNAHRFWEEYRQEFDVNAVHDIKAQLELFAYQIKGANYDNIGPADVDSMLSAYHNEIHTIVRSYTKSAGSRIFPQQTQFEIYLAITRFISQSQHRVHYFDPYLRPSFFWRFLPELSPTVEICIVTTKGKCAPGNRFGFAAVESVSEIAVSAFQNYRLLVEPRRTTHPRLLRVDDRILSLDKGATDTSERGIGVVSEIDAAESDHEKLDSIIDAATELHGSDT